MQEDKTYQRLKILYLYKILLEETDNTHELTMPQIIDKLSEYGISAARKALYEDIQALRQFGADITSGFGNGAGYCIASRDFELPELKLLADAVASSRFFTERKAKALLTKLETLCSKYEADQIKREVMYIADRDASENERIYMNIDAINQAILKKRQISFRYFDYNIKKRKEYRRGLRVCSPYALTWSDERYYLIAHYEKYGGISHFRVDKMESVRVLVEPSHKMEKEFKLSEYMRSTFSMFSGTARTVELRFDNSLINAVIDRFGRGIKLAADDETHFTVKIQARTDQPETFFGWLFQFGAKAQIMAPADIKEQYSEMLRNVLKSESESADG